VGEALHSFGHRAESIMTHTYGLGSANTDHNWNRFTRLDKDAPGLGGLGSVHVPVNGASDYDYANPQVVVSNADDWRHYPNFTGVTRAFNFHEWSPNGADPQREYLNWWYDHLPHFSGKGPDQLLNNWWRYIIDVDPYKGWFGSLQYADGLPTVQLTAPNPGSTVSGVVQVRANAAVNGALGRVDFYVDGAYRSTDTIAPYTFAWNTRGLSGTHTLQAKAYELQNGTEAITAPLTATVDSQNLVLGDVNGDGEVNVQDAILALRSLVGLTSLSAAQGAAGDMNGDGKVRIQDVNALLRKALGVG
jgi:hypothetical protein